MGPYELSRKVKRAIGKSGPVQVLLRPTPQAFSATVRCASVDMPDEQLREKWKGFVNMGVYDGKVTVEALEEDIDFLIQTGELLIAFQ